MTTSRAQLADSAFIVAVLLKGVGGFVELLSGLLLAFISPDLLRHLLAPLAHVGLEFGDITGGVKLFGAIYFTSRGILRMGLAIALLKEWLWAYPVTLLFLGASILYQAWLLAHGHFSTGLLGLTLFDCLIVGLTAYEYRKLRAGGHLDHWLTVRS